MTAPSTASPASSPTATHRAADDLVADVVAAAHAYERALVDGDVAAATAWFDDAADVSRFGPEGPSYGPAEVAAVRAATPPTVPATWRHEAVVALAVDAAVHVAELDRGDVVVQRTQVWRRRPAGWRIAHAHVSRRPAR